MSWGSVIGGAVSLIGGAASAKSAKKAAKQAAATQEQLHTTLGPSSITGPGGSRATLTNDGTGGSINLGDMTNARNILTQFGTNGIGAASGMGGGLPPAVMQALQGLRRNSGTPGMPNTSGLQGAVDSTMLNSMFDMNRGSAAPGLAATAFGGAGRQLAAAGGNFNDVRDQTLQNLRSQAQPFEQRQMDDLNNNLFSTGRLGSSGGGLMMESFARGLGQADQGRVLSANQEARTAQNNALGLGQGLAGIGQNMTGLDDSLLQSAFGRFAQTAGLSQGLNQERFGNSMLLNQTGFDRAQNNFQNQVGISGLPMALQGQQLQLGMQGLGGAQQLDAAGMQQFQAALAAAQAGANARIGSGSNVAAMAGTVAGMPTSGDIWGNILTGAGARIAQNDGSGKGLFGGLFGGGSAPKSPPVVGQNPNSWSQQAAWAGG